MPKQLNRLFAGDSQNNIYHHSQNNTTLAAYQQYYRTFVSLVRFR